MIWDLYVESFALLFLRSVGVTALLPMEGLFRGIIRRLAIALLLTIFFMFRLNHPNDSNAMSYLFEFLIGLLLAFPIVFTLHLAALLGELFDVGRGQSIASFYDPVSNLQQSQMGMLFREFVWLQFLIAGGLLVLLDALGESLLSLPLGESSSKSFFDFGHNLLLLQINFLTKAMICALPLAAIFLMLNFLGAMLAKVLPTLALYQEVFLISTMIGFYYLAQLFSLGDWYLLAELGNWSLRYF